VPVHADTERIAQNRTAVTVADRAVDGSTAGVSGTRTTLPPLPNTCRTRWPCSSPRSLMLTPQASKIRSPSRPKSVTSTKSFGFIDSRAVVISASNCTCPRLVSVSRAVRRPGRCKPAQLIFANSEVALGACSAIENGLQANQLSIPRRRGFGPGGRRGDSTEAAGNPIAIEVRITQHIGVCTPLKVTIQARRLPLAPAT
jgi:hypothetical protein